MLPLSATASSPGAEHDGVTVHVPLTRAAAAARRRASTGSCPPSAGAGDRADPRRCRRTLRRRLVPVPDTRGRGARAPASRASEPLADAVARGAAGRCAASASRATTSTSARLPAHLRMTFRVEDERGAAVARGRRTSTRCASRRARGCAPSWPRPRAAIERERAASWTIGELPRTVALPGTAQAVRGYPALVDEGDTVGGARCSRRRPRRRAAMRPGTRRLLLLAVPSPVRARAAAAWPTPQQLALAGAPHGALGRGARRRDRPRRLDALIAEAGGPAWDEAGFARLRAHVAGRPAPTTARGASRRSVRILGAAREVERPARRRSRRRRSRRSRRDVERQLARLVHAGLRRRATGAGGCPTSSATCSGRGAAAGAAARRARPSTATGCARSTSSRRRTAQRLEALAAGRAAARGAARGRAGCSRSCG